MAQEEVLRSFHLVKIQEGVPDSIYTHSEKFKTPSDVTNLWLQKCRHDCNAGINMIFCSLGGQGDGVFLEEATKGTCTRYLPSISPFQ